MSAARRHGRGGARRHGAGGRAAAGPGRGWASWSVTSATGRSRTPLTPRSQQVGEAPAAARIMSSIAGHPAMIAMTRTGCTYCEALARLAGCGVLFALAWHVPTGKAVTHRRSPVPQDATESIFWRQPAAHRRRRAVAVMLAGMPFARRTGTPVNLADSLRTWRRPARPGTVTYSSPSPQFKDRRDQRPRGATPGAILAAVMPATPPQTAREAPPGCFRRVTCPSTSYFSDS